MIHINLMALSFTEPELEATKVLQCRNKDIRLFCSCDLDLDPVTFIYEPDPYSLEIYRMCKYKNSHIKTFQIYCLTDRDGHDQNYIHLCVAGGQL